MQESRPSITSLARPIRWVIIILVIALIATHLLGAFKPSFGPVEIMETYELNGIGFGARTLGVLAIVLGLIQLERILYVLERGDPFVAAVVKGLQRFAILASLGFVLVIAAPTLSALTSPGAGHVTITIQMRDFVTLAICLVFFVVAALVGEAVRIAAENKEFI